MPTVPLETDPEAILQLTLQHFRGRIFKNITADDIDFLERAMRAYGEGMVKEGKG